MINFFQIEELDNNNMTLQKIRSNLAAQLDEQKRIADDESKERGFLLGKYRHRWWWSLEEARLAWC